MDNDNSDVSNELAARNTAVPSDATISQYSGGLAKMLSPIEPYHFNTDMVPSRPEFVFQMDTSRSRPFTLRLTYITGAGYLTGLTIGGSWGVFEGFNSILLMQESSRKVKFTALLNSITRRGPFLGNNLGILSMYFAFSEQVFRKFRNKEDKLNKMLAAVSAGCLWRSTKSFRAIIFAGIMGGTIVGSYYIFDI